MHIPDGFLSTPVWAALDVTAAPVVLQVARRAQRTLDQGQIPLLGVLGAFVFAAQMVNFPVGPGTSGHLVGGALLAFTLGPAPASIVMVAILAIQALVFQDGGILALGANIVNMALVGVLAGYLPYSLWSQTRWRRASIFAGGALSVLASAILALAELLASGVRMGRPILGIALVLFAVSAILEGGITLAVIEALEKSHPKTRLPTIPAKPPLLAAISLAALVMASVGFLFASVAPDGIQKLGQQSGIAAHVQNLVHTPFGNYRAAFIGSEFLGKAAAGLAGAVLIFGACVLLGRAARNRSV